MPDTPITPELREKMKSCSGCTEDFYNDKNPYGVKMCWSLPTAQIQTRHRISMDAPMHRRSNYQEVQVFNCRRERGCIFLTPEAFRHNATEE